MTGTARRGRCNGVGRGSRSFADILILLFPGDALPRWGTRRRLQQIFVVLVTGVVPAHLYGVVEDPVSIMSASGVIGAVHTPFVAALILLANLRHLPQRLGPGLLSAGLLGTAGLFYLAVSVLTIASG